MSDLVAEVFEYIKQHPLCNLARIQQDFRKPPQEIEHSVSLLRRTGKIVQKMPGLWTTKGPEEKPAGAVVPVPPPPAINSTARLIVSPAPMIQAKRTVHRLPKETLPFGQKRCPRCKEVKPKPQFSKSGYCTECSRAYARDRYARNKDAKPTPDRPRAPPLAAMLIKSLLRLKAEIDQMLTALGAL